MSPPSKSSVPAGIDTAISSGTGAKVAGPGCCILAGSILGCSSCRPPEPAQRVGQHRASMLAIMATRSSHEPMVIAPVFEGGNHLQVRQPPVPPLVIEVRFTILKVDAQRPRRLLAKERGVDMSATNVRKGADVRQHLAKSVWALPGDREGTDATR